MAGLVAEAPDPKTFKTWEDAFKYPVPAVRRLQQQLRSDISGNRERLRTLVGGSYRELLGTADTIVQMDAQMQEVEVLLGETSMKCNTSRLGKSFRNQSQLMAQKKATEKERYATASQLAILQRCPEVIIRTLKKGGSVLQVSKILVIARRLYRKLMDGQVAVAYVEKVWSRLGKLRQKVLRVIDRRLASTRTENPALVDALCAYALAAGSASATDLLRHFHHVRQDALTATIATDPSDNKPILESLRLWIKTLQDTRAVFPKQLAVGLSKLKSSPLLKDEGIQNTIEFDLDIHEPWLGEDVRNFIPYLRHDDLTVAAASQQLSSWAPTALKTLLSNLQQSLATVEDLKKVDDLRRGCLELLFSHYHTPGARKEVVLGGFRDTFEKKLLGLVEQRCRGIEAIGGEVKTLLENWESANTAEQPSSLWSDQILSMDTSKGGEAFTSAVQTAIEGRTPVVKTATDKYQTWLSTVQDISSVVDGMRQVKWEDHLDDFSDSDSDDESDTTRKQIQSKLKVDDPNALDEAFSKTLALSVTAFVKSISSLATRISSLSADRAQAQASFLLRVIREVKRHPPPKQRPSSLDFSCMPQLHGCLAAPPIVVALARNSTRIGRALRQQRPAGRVLWEGEPELPQMPSPWLFRLLKDLEAELAAIGTDVWTPDAVVAVRLRLRDALLQELEPLVKAKAIGRGADGAEGAESQDKNSAEGAEEQNGAEGAKGAEGVDKAGMSRDAAMQLVFDLHYLACASEGAPSDAGAAMSALKASAETIAELQQADLAKARALAEAYRERTALLFPLANGAE